MINKFSIYTFLLLFLISCSQYQSEYREDAIIEYKNVYGFSNLDLDDDEILNQVNTECELIKEGIEDHLADDLPIYYFIDFYYIIKEVLEKKRRNLKHI